MSSAKRALIDVPYDELHEMPALTLYRAVEGGQIDISGYDLCGDEDYSRKQGVLDEKLSLGRVAYDEWVRDALHSMTHGDPSEASPQWVERHGFVDFSTFWDEEPAPLDFLIPGVLAAGRLTSLYSPPKAGKSLVMLEAMARLSEGLPVFGLPAREPMRVMYVDHENIREDLFSRLDAMGFRDRTFERLHYSLLGTWPPLDTAQGADALEMAVKTFEPEVVVIDTASRTIQGLEDKADTWLQWYRHTGLMLKRHEVAAVRLDHTGKDVTRGARGSSAKDGDPDLVVSMTPIAVGVALHVTRSRVSNPTERLVLRRETTPVLHHVIEHGTVAVAMAEAQERVDNFVDVLDEHGVPADWSYARVRDAARASKGTDGEWKCVAKELVLAAQKARRDRDGEAKVV